MVGPASSHFLYRSEDRIEQRLARGHYARHGHSAAYAAVVLSGNYIESGDTGRWKASAGQIVFHAAYEAHLNVVERQIDVINIPVPFGTELPPVFTARDLDEVIYVAKSDSRAAWKLLTPACDFSPLMDDWVDVLAADIRRRPVHLGEWAKEYGLAAATVSRTFRSFFGVTPIAYRSGARARSALKRLASGRDSIAHIASDCGYADQAHLCRSIVDLTGRTPSTWRKVKGVQDCAERAA